MRSFLLLILMFISVFAFAQQPIGYNTHNPNLKEGVLRKNGRMWYIKSLTGPTTLKNGEIVNVDGSLKLYNKTSKLLENQCINFNGKKTKLSHKMSKDGEIVFINNVVYVWSLLDKPVRLSNGTYVLPDGTLRLQSGKYQKFNEGDFINFDGNWYVLTI